MITRLCLYACLTSFFLVGSGCEKVGEANPPAPIEQIDPVSVAPELFSTMLENDYVRVVEYKLAPGQSDIWHTHPAKVAYVVSGGELRVHLGDGKTLDVIEKTGDAAWSDALGKHYVQNVGETPVHIVLVEVKSAEQ